jgi:hypothetical protein
MVDEGPKGLFEALKSAKREPEGIRIPSTPKPPPPPAGQKPIPGPAPASPGSGRFAVQLTRRQALAALAVIVAVALATMYWGYRIGQKAPFLGDQYLPSVEKTAGSPPRPAVLEATGPRKLNESVMGYSSGGAATEGEPPSRVEAPTPSSRLIAEPAAEPTATTGGAYRIRVFAVQESHREAVERERKRLQDGGIATVIDHRGTWYYIYTKQTFASADGDETIRVLKQVKDMGFDTAFALKKD